MSEQQLHGSDEMLGEEGVKRDQERIDLERARVIEEDRRTSMAPTTTPEEDDDVRD